MEKAVAQVAELREVALDIKDKLEQYYHEALTKSVYGSAAILDPRIKLNFIKGHVSNQFTVFHIKLIVTSCFLTKISRLPYSKLRKLTLKERLCISMCTKILLKLVEL